MFKVLSLWFAVRLLSFGPRAGAVQALEVGVPFTFGMREFCNFKAILEPVPVWPGTFANRSNLTSYL